MIKRFKKLKSIERLRKLGNLNVTSKGDVLKGLKSDICLLINEAIKDNVGEGMNIELSDKAYSKIVDSFSKRYKKLRFYVESGHTSIAEAKDELENDIHNILFNLFYRFGLDADERTDLIVDSFHDKYCSNTFENYAEMASIEYSSHLDAESAKSVIVIHSIKKRKPYVGTTAHLSDKELKIIQRDAVLDYMESVGYKYIKEQDTMIRCKKLFKSKQSDM